jgi:hypothetical protein
LSGSIITVLRSIRARRAASKAGTKNASFEVGTAKDFPGAKYDLVTFFDCLHDMGDPVGAARHVREMLNPDGAWMIVEPFAHDKLEENLNPVGRVFYSASTYDLHAGVAGAGGRVVPGRAGRRGAYAQSGNGRGFHQVPTRG